MTYNQGNVTDSTGEPFLEGTEVFDADGEKVGTVSEHGVQDNNLVVHRGLLRQDVYIPLNVVARSDPQGIYLTVTKDDVLNQDRDAAATWSGPTRTSGDVFTTETEQTGASHDTVAEEDTVRVPLWEEELAAGKREQEIGRVRLHKDVVEEQQTITELVTREEVQVERAPVQGEYTPGPDAFIEKHIDVRVMGEELIVEKRARVTEEVRLHKRPVTEEQQVTDTVRKERVTVEGADEVYGADNQTDVTR